MLVLTRKSGDRLVIGDNIILTVAEIRGDSVRLAFDAPKDVKIYRGEIYDAIVKENKQAAMQPGFKNIDFLKEVPQVTKK